MKNTWCCLAPLELPLVVFAAATKRNGDALLLLLLLTKLLERCKCASRAVSATVAGMGGGDSDGPFGAGAESASVSTVSSTSCTRRSSFGVDGSDGGGSPSASCAWSDCGFNSIFRARFDWDVKCQIL